MLLAQLTGLHDEQPAISCLAVGRTLSHDVDMAGRSLAVLFAASTVTDRKESAHYTFSEARKAGLFDNKTTTTATTTARQS